MNSISILTDFPTQYFCKALNTLNIEINIFTLFEKSDIRSSDFYSNNSNIDSINKKDNFYNRKKYFNRIRNLIKSRNNFKNIVCICGWDYFEYWFLLIFLKPKFVIFNLESTIIESKSVGLAGLLKKYFLTKVDFILVPGQRQKDLAIKLGFKKDIYFLNGVGFHYWYGEKLVNSREIKNIYNNILYVGRLSSEKGVDMILEVAKRLPNYNFTIIGSGPEENILMFNINKENLTNINIIGYVNNTNLVKYYLENDILVLPSYSEVWGLVVEEAAHFKLPVLTSDIVGCVDDIVLKNKIGFVFENSNILDFKEKIENLSELNTYKKIQSNYASLNLYNENPFEIAFNNILKKCL